jgi:hypothetical protein
LFCMVWKPEKLFHMALCGCLRQSITTWSHDFYNGSRLPLYCLNFGTITLLPKAQEVTKIQQYRPVCMLNVSFKIFTKVIANRLSLIASKVIGPSQSTFLSGVISWREW